MNDKLTFSEVTALLAIASGASKELAEDFVKEFFSLISATLEKGESVRIKNFGTFKITEVEARRGIGVTTGEEMEFAAHKRVSFIAAKEMAEMVNKAFSMFEAVEISEGISEEMLNDAGENAHPPKQQGQLQEIPKEKDPADDEEPENENAVAEVEEELTEPIPAEELPEVNEEFLKAVKSEEEEEVETEVASEIEEAEEEERENPRRSWLWFVCGFCAGLVAAACIIFCVPGVHESAMQWLMPSSASENMKIIAVEPAPVSTISMDSVNSSDGSDEIEESASDEEVAPTKPSDVKEICDTVTKTRYLGTMAREYYGDYHFWPYIYEANSKVLGHPDRIKPGTKVVIPNLQKLGVNPKSEADIATAKRKGMEIYGRYK